MNTMDPEVHSLTGAYVCHALDPAERTAFERHLARCPVCAQEVAELQETTALLASAVAETAPPRLKAAVDARVAVTRQIAPVLAHAPTRHTAPRPAWQTSRQPSHGPNPRPRRRWFTALGWGLATGLAAAVAVLGVQSGDQQHQLDQARQQSTGITALLSAPDARTDTASVRTGGVGTVLVSRSHDAAAITVDGLAKLPPGKAYQLWMMGPSGTRSGGLLAAGADGSTGPVLAHGLGDAQTIGLTVEPAGGSAQPTTTPVMLLPMPA
ncbi:anti-sigma factor RsiW [Catenulispora sp. EB89]|uniref:anti-sigma factor n=1 Tax=Catenulispora sp. EB89 TaxID=3156257 RepID=UPI003517A252